MKRVSNSSVSVVLEGLHCSLFQDQCPYSNYHRATESI
nr:MAG TPA: hypothetical protein [Caudoviricetes sp.]